MLACAIPWYRRSWLLGAWCLLLVILADWWFYHHPVGWTLGAYGAVVVAAILARGPRVLGTPGGGLLVVGLLGLTGALVESPGWITIALVGVGLASLAVFSRYGIARTIEAWLEGISTLALTAWARIFLDTGIVYAWRQSHVRHIAWRSRHHMQWVLAGVFGLVFVNLFTLANPVIQHWMVPLSDLFESLWEGFSPPRVLLWIAVGTGAWGLLRARVHVTHRVGGTVEQPPTMPPGRDAGATGLERFFIPGLVVRCLVVFNALFLVQTGLDMLYLFGGADLPEGMTYAQYAHRGAYPLLATALIAAVFVLITFRPQSPTAADPWCRRLVYAWLVQNVFLTFSSVWRLWLYVEVYSLTRWRVAAAIWMGLVAAGLGWILWRIIAQRSNAWLVHVNLFTLIAVLYFSAFIDIDGFIASYNVRHCRQVTGRGTPLDLGYLEHLGVESLPALSWLIEETRGRAVLDERPGRPRMRLVSKGNPKYGSQRMRPLNEAAIEARARLERRLRAKLSDWRGWTFRRQRLAQESVAE